MKNKFCSMPSKVACFLLCVISICIFAASVIGAVGLWSEGFYTHSEKYLIDEALCSSLSSDAYELIRYALYPETKPYTTQDFNVDSTNLRYRIIDSEWNILKTNLVDASGGEWKYNFTFSKSEYIYQNLGAGIIPGEGHYIFQANLEDGLPINDDYSIIAKFVSIGYDIRYWIFLICAVSFVLSVVLFVILMCASGRHPNNDKICGGALNSVPFDLLVAVIFFAVMAVGLTFGNNINFTDEFEVVFIAFIAIIFVSIFIGLCMSFAARIKQKTLFRNTIIYLSLKLSVRFTKFVFRQIKTICQNLPILWKTIAAVTVIFVYDMIILITVTYGNDFGAILFFFKIVALGVVSIYTVLFMNKLQKGAEKLAEGDFGHKVDTNKMFWDFKKHGENLNRVSEGMSIAVEKRLQSERSKTELITNVSHDIKTPLTSIINYASLIGKSECDCEHHKEYSEVLVRKSKHLKRLLDDIVEISKAATGNLEISLSECDSTVLLSQISGEFDEMCEKAGLELVVKQPEKPIFIMADSRRIWRVFENLMSNVCKYSLENSRVYVSFEERDGFARFIFRNTSKNALDITPDELAERFVRGDASRSTEGNGLGLSIAKSLTELQNGKMEIQIDGDLFKVILNFPMI